ncbi:hypothetical protein BJ138DRAFT_867907 [Hygrophoropsis aurantiaca]|uniref:Uncharacterized protein n=1 Tax=Hygrophoropsis aurantiaca TaxID=72124 RepID=A0ACB7ZUL7_9AGAM|nr:hypothetical protein BJ138DRAFT_867907 [Hygrophoropsis aurantiaca]
MNNVTELWTILQLIWSGCYRTDYSVCNVFRAVIPHPQDRIPITIGHWPYAVLPFIPFLFLAYLARRPDTHTLRLLLLPITVASILGTAFRFVWVKFEFNVYDWGQGLLAEALIAKAIGYAWRKDGMLKIGETKPNISLPSVKENGHIAHSPPTSAFSMHNLFPRWFRDAVELGFSMRGIGWHYGTGVYIPEESRPLDRKSFLRSTTVAILKNYLLLDLLDTLIKHIPGVGSPHGGSIYFSNLPLPVRFFVGFIIHSLTGSCIIAAFEMAYDLATVFSVLLLDYPPSAWPPIIENPWKARSLHEFWAKRWHQTLRETFFVMGGHPGRLIAGDVGMILGTFIGSGLYHELAAYAVGRGFDYRVLLFFAMQGPFLIIERLWRKFTGRRVGGRFGQLWTAFSILALGQVMADSWHMRGLGGGVIVPISGSPMRRLVLPLLKSIMKQHWT